MYMWGKKSYKNVWTHEWGEYCNDGWMFLNKRPTMMCLGEKKSKKSSGPGSLLTSLSSLTSLLLTALLYLFRFPSHCSGVFYTSSLCTDLLQTMCVSVCVCVCVSVCVCVCVCVCMLVEVCFDCVLFFALWEIAHKRVHYYYYYY